MPPLNMYGMSETAGAATSWSFNRAKFNTCGTPITSVDFKIDNPNSEGEGEICMRGRSIFMGYLKNKEETLKVFDKDGYLHSGDLGMLDEDGYLVITGRIKELIITGGGENVAPVLIETAFKDSCPICSNIMIIGDGRKFLSALVGIKTEMDQNQGPTNILTNEVTRFF